MRAWHRRSGTISEAGGDRPRGIWTDAYRGRAVRAGAAAIVAAWAGSARRSKCRSRRSGPAGEIDCVSYAPFRGDQNPFGPAYPFDPWQIDEDLAQLKPLTDCIRTYSIDHGLDQIPEIAQRHGLKVMQGLWLSSLPDLNRKQIETTIALANRYPDVIEAVIVGNEVLLRGEMSAPDLARTIREVKAQVPMPVTYADVWEFWLRYREVAAAVDFITIHILPYWEDHPDPGRARPRGMSTHPQADRRRLSRQGGLPRRIRLAERGPHARGRVAVADQRGARAARGGGAGQARELPGQRDRGLRPALEAPARRHRRRALGPVRRLRAQGQVRLGRRRSPTIRTGAGRRPAASALRRSSLPPRWRPCWLHPPPPARVWLGVAAMRRRVRDADRLDDRERADRKPHGGRLDALAGLGGGRDCGAGRRRGGGRVAARTRPELCAHARTPRGPCRAIRLPLRSASC